MQQAGSINILYSLFISPAFSLYIQKAVCTVHRSYNQTTSLLHIWLDRDETLLYSLLLVVACRILQRLSFILKTFDSLSQVTGGSCPPQLELQVCSPCVKFVVVRSQGRSWHDQSLASILPWSLSRISLEQKFNKDYSKPARIFSLGKVGCFECCFKTLQQLWRLFCVK